MTKLIIGLTGGIGSGKTAVSTLFSQKGIDVIDADIVAREVVEIGTPALSRIAEHFGPVILSADGSLDRAALRKTIFSDPAAKQWLEALLHPLIAEETRRQLAHVSSPYGLYVSPLLVEMGQQNYCQRLLIVDVSEDTQLQRTMNRDNNDRAQVERIMASQANRRQRREAADDIIDNSGDLASLAVQVDRLHAHYLTLAKELS